MKHGYGYKKLGRNTQHRRAMLRNLATSLIEQGAIRTTLPKAKSLRPIVEKLVTLGKKGGLHAQRQIAEYLFDRSLATKVMTDLAQQYKSRPGGYLRILRLGTRFGDGAQMARIEFVDAHAKSDKSASKKSTESTKKVVTKSKDTTEKTSVAEKKSTSVKSKTSKTSTKTSSAKASAKSKG